MRMESVSIKNFRVLRDVTLGDLSPMSVIVGKNGSGKSTLFEVFAFLKDALTHNVSSALEKRGGFHEVLSRDSSGPIEVELKFRESAGRLATYKLAINTRDNRPIVEREVLQYRRGQRGQPWKFVDFSNGSGLAVTNEADYSGPESDMTREQQELESPDILAIKGLGQFQRFRVASDFRRLLEQWHLSDFHIGDARPSQEAGYAEHLSPSGDNLSLVAKYLYVQHPPVFRRILARMSERVPGVANVEATKTVDGRIVLRFKDGSFKDPFIARNVSDGTIKMFAYLVLLYDPSPHPLLCVEEPENQLYPELMHELAEEFRSYGERGGQIMVSTHSPEFLSATKVDEVYVLEKKAGFSVAQRLADNQLVQALVAEGDSLGNLMRQGLLSEDGAA